MLRRSPPTRQESKTVQFAAAPLVWAIASAHLPNNWPGACFCVHAPISINVVFRKRGKKYVESHTRSCSYGCRLVCSDCLFCLAVECKGGRCCAGHHLCSRIRSRSHLQLPRRCGQLHLHINPVT